MDGAKEDAADEDPEHDGKPAEGHGDDRTVTGPAPQIELNWCENAVKAETGEKLLPSFMRLAGVRASLSTPHLLASHRP